MMDIERRIFKNVLWDTIEDYTKLLHLLPSIYNDISEQYDSDLKVAKKILLFFVENNYVALFYEDWRYPNNYFEVPKDKSLKLLIENSSWEVPTQNDLWITVSATPKGKELYYSDRVMDESFKVPQLF
ncbi:hypothetical protein [Riemerella anatipestifer]|uniref:hypothetical protein n=1 Tax=Riemerella anatipestifer TaxID=34085 RepID=UPI0013752537|nr:hypothetical protein [Riemerella anatipestifer]